MHQNNELGELTTILERFAFRQSKRVNSSFYGRSLLGLRNSSLQFGVARPEGAPGHPPRKVMEGALVYINDKSLHVHDPKFDMD